MQSKRSHTGAAHWIDKDYNLINSMSDACVSKLTIIGSDNGLSPGQRHAIIWPSDGILLIPTLGTNFSEILSEIHTFSLKKMQLKMSSRKWRPFCLALNVSNLPSERLLYSCLHKGWDGQRGRQTPLQSAGGTRLGRVRHSLAWSQPEWGLSGSNHFGLSNIGSRLHKD